MCSDKKIVILKKISNKKTYTGNVAVDDSILTGSTLASSLTAIMDCVETDF